MASRGSQEVPRRLPGPPQEMRPLFSPKGSFAEFEPLCSDLSVSTDRAKCEQARPRPKMPRTYPCSLTCSQNGNREPTKLRLWGQRRRRKKHLVLCVLRGPDSPKWSKNHDFLRKMFSIKLVSTICLSRCVRNLPYIILGSVKP